MQKFLKILAIFVAAMAVLIAAFYIFYVRSIGVKPQIEPPRVIHQRGTYAWSVKAEMPTPRTEVTAAALEGKIYVIGGFDSIGRTVSVVEVYDPGTDSWSRGPDLPEPRHHAVAVEEGGFLYVLGGFSGIGFQPHASVFVFDPRSNQWSRKADMPSPRGAFAAGAWDGNIYAVGGVGPEGLSNALFVYDTATDRWEERASARMRREHLAAAILNGMLYVAGGREGSLSKNLNALEIYDPATDTWSEGPVMPTARGGVAGAWFENMLVVLGGEEPTRTFGEAEAFDFAEEQWIRLPNLPTARHGLAAATVENKLYVIGGGKRPGLSVSGAHEVLAAVREPNIVVTAPKADDEIGLPLVIKGSARVFENTFNFRLMDEDGTVLMEDFGTANAPDIGFFGPFEVMRSYRAPRGARGTLEVFAYSAKDGSEIEKVTIPIRFRDVEAISVKVFFSSRTEDPNGLFCERTYPVNRRIAQELVPRFSDMTRLAGEELATLARLTLEEMLRGPDRLEVESGFFTNINSGVEVRSLEVRGGVAYVDFGEMLGVGVAGSCRVAAIRSQIERTLLQFPAIRDAKISVAGRSDDILQP